MNSGDNHPGAGGGPRKSGSRGVVFFNIGQAYIVRLLVAIHSLRRFWSGGVTVFLADPVVDPALIEQLQHLRCDVRHLDGLSVSWDRDRLFRESPYDTTLSCDADLIFRAPIDPLWEPLESEGLLVTRFSPNPYGVNGTPNRRGWADRVSHLNSVRKLLGEPLHAAALKRMTVDHVDVNIGVLGVSRPVGQRFLDDFSARMEAGRQSRIPLMDEMLVVGMLPAHRHALAGERWNCPADVFFRTTPLEAAAIVHYFADAHRVQDLLLGRSPARSAGRLWFNAAAKAAREIDLKRWIAFDKAVLTHKVHAQKEAARLVVTKTPPSEPVSSVSAPPVAVQVAASAEAKSLPLASVILMSYRRPQNLQRIVDAVAVCDFVAEIIVSNNNPEIRLADWINTRDSRLRIIEQPERRYPSIRLDLSREATCDCLISIDDDVFLEAAQVRAIHAALCADPRSPHGVAGHLYGFGPRSAQEAIGIYSRNSTVDSLVWAYAYTKAHVKQYFALLDQLRISNDALRWNEDVPLSFAGTQPALIHDVGPLKVCVTSQEAGIATHKEHGFDTDRVDVLNRLRQVTGRLPGRSMS